MMGNNNQGPILIDLIDLMHNLLFYLLI